MKLLIFTLITLFSISSFANQSNDSKIREALTVSLIESTISCQQTLATKNGFNLDYISTFFGISDYIKSENFSLVYNQEESFISINLINGTTKYTIHFNTNTSFNKVLSFTAKSSDILSSVSFHGTFANPEFGTKDIVRDFNIIECSVEYQNPTDLE